MLSCFVRIGTFCPFSFVLSVSFCSVLSVFSRFVQFCHVLSVSFRFVSLVLACLALAWLGFDLINCFDLICV